MSGASAWMKTRAPQGSSRRSRRPRRAHVGARAREGAELPRLVIHDPGGARDATVVGRDGADDERGRPSRSGRSGPRSRRGCPPRAARSGSTRKSRWRSSGRSARRAAPRRPRTRRRRSRGEAGPDDPGGPPVEEKAREARSAPAITWAPSGEKLRPKRASVAIAARGFAFPQGSTRSCPAPLSSSRSRRAARRAHRRGDVEVQVESSSQDAPMPFSDVVELDEPGRCVVVVDEERVRASGVRPACAR